MGEGQAGRPFRQGQGQAGERGNEAGQAVRARGRHRWRRARIRRAVRPKGRYVAKGPGRPGRRASSGPAGAGAGVTYVHGVARCQRRRRQGGIGRQVGSGWRWSLDPVRPGAGALQAKGQRAATVCRLPWAWLEAAWPEQIPVGGRGAAPDLRLCRCVTTAAALCQRHTTRGGHTARGGEVARQSDTQCRGWRHRTRARTASQGLSGVQGAAAQLSTRGGCCSRLHSGPSSLRPWPRASSERST